jgi:N-acetyltransferase
VAEPAAAFHLAHVPLENTHVHLAPYTRAAHGNDLRAMSEAHPELYAFWSHRGPGDWIGQWLDVIDTRAALGTTRAYAVMHPQTRAFLGITAYLDPNAEHRNTEIGMTVYHPSVHGTNINPAAKHLLLGHVFAAGALRVQFQIDSRNQRSQAAVLKLGASREGVLRSHKIVADGYVRDTVLFSVLAREWPDVKAGLETRLS